MINLGNIEIADLRLGLRQVQAVYIGNEQVWGSEQPPAPAGDWLCFTAEQANSTVGLYKYGSPYDISIETSTDGNTWTDYSWSSLSLANVGDKVYMRAKSENQNMSKNYLNYYIFGMTGKIAASGNIQTLLKADGSRTDAHENCYRNIFKNCTSLTTAPKLPATTVEAVCYSDMFSGCTSLTAAPALPATTVNVNCYNSMFKNCTSLTTAPALPATIGVYNSYSNMFQGCTSLSSVEVALTAWTSQATDNWLQNVAPGGTFKCPTALGTNETITRGVSNCPAGWTVVNIDAA